MEIMHPNTLCRMTDKGDTITFKKKGGGEGGKNITLGLQYLHVYSFFKDNKKRDASGSSARKQCSIVQQGHESGAQTCMQL